MKILWLDCEATGLDPKIHDIVSLACLVEIDGEIKDTLELKIQPINWDTISPEALKINGFTLEQLKTFDEPKIAHKKLIDFLSKYVNRYDRNDKFQMAGYNVGFDVGMLGEQFKKVGDKYYGAWLDYHKIDIASLVQLLTLKNVLHLSSYKLINVVKDFDIKLDAHNALSDIKATRELCYKLLDKIEFKE